MVNYFNYPSQKTLIFNLYYLKIKILSFKGQKSSFLIKKNLKNGFLGFKSQNFEKYMKKSELFATTFSKLNYCPVKIN